MRDYTKFGVVSYISHRQSALSVFLRPKCLKSYGLNP